MQMVMLEIDNVIADISHRVDINHNGLTAEAISAKIPYDRPNRPLIDALSFWASQGYIIVINSSRSEVFREETEIWLMENGVDYNHLHMRPIGNRDTNENVKKMAVQYYKKLKTHSLSIVLENNMKIAKMYHAHPDCPEIMICPIF